MTKLLTLGLSALAALALTAPAPAADQPITPFPAAHSGDVFVVAQTVASDGSMANWYAPGSTVAFRAYAVNGKTGRMLAQKDVRYFYVTIPGAPNVKLKYTPKAAPATGLYTWTGSWTIPAAYPLGIVSFKVLVQTTTKLRGSFVQVPVASSQLTVSTTPPASTGAGPAASTGTGAAKVNVALYVDSVNGTRPTGAAPRPIGCTQTNVYKRGEQVVIRTWGFDLASGAVLTTDNVSEAKVSIAGQPDVVLAWGGHGPTGNKVWFWANAWNIPTTYALGDTTLHVQFKLVNGTVGTFDYTVTVVP